MKIYLYDNQKRENIELNLEPEYSTTINDLYVVFISKDTVCSLENGKESKPYNDYYIKKITHIVGAKLNYEDCECSLIIGFYATNDNIIPFLIEQNNSNGYIMFANSSLNDIENNFGELLFFNYNEYLLLMELGIEKLTIKDYLIRLINNRMGNCFTKLYKTPNISENNLIDYKEFEKFLDQEKLK